VSAAVTAISVYLVAVGATKYTEIAKERAK
jgi:hypothetical protein